MGLALLDTNVLIYAAYRRSPLHEIAAILVDRALPDSVQRSSIDAFRWGR